VRIYICPNHGQVKENEVCKIDGIIDKGYICKICGRSDDVLHKVKVSVKGDLTWALK